MKTREQDYAATIYDQVKNDVKGNDFQDEYKTHAKNLAFLIRSAGLVQAVYFTDSRMSLLIEHLAQVIEKKEENETNEQHKKNFLEIIRKADINSYIYLTEKSLLALKWYKRCVDIHIKDKRTKENPDDNGEKDENNEA